MAILNTFDQKCHKKLYKTTTKKRFICTNKCYIFLKIKKGYLKTLSIDNADNLVFWCRF